jgi:putative sterol carrier protein
LLDLPAPGAETSEAITRIEDLTATVQFCLTGPGGSTWYVLCDKGSITYHDGTANSPDTTVTTSASVWAAIQKGEMNQFHAWTSGKLKIDGDHAVLHLLEDVISKAPT